MTVVCQPPKGSKSPRWSRWPALKRHRAAKVGAPSVLELHRAGAGARPRRHRADRGGEGHRLAKTAGLTEAATAVVVLALLTVWLSGAAVVVAAVEIAVAAVNRRDRVPATESEEIAPLVAVPPLKLTGLPKAEPSIENCTVPVGVPAPGATALTVAVKVTDWPKTDGLAEEATLVVVPAGLTIWMSGEEVLSLILK